MPHPPHPRGRGLLRGAGAAGRTGLTADELVAALSESLLGVEEAAAMTVHGRTESAVLAPLYIGEDGRVHAVFTKRRDDLKRHAGEISFPGGRRDEEDESLVDTALREAEEEIGLGRDHVRLAGALPPTPTFVTNYSIYPYVGVIEPGHVWEIQAAEVDVILELPLAEVRDAYARKRLVRRGIAFRTDTYTVGENLIWGATGRIVHDLLARIAPLI